MGIGPKDANGDDTYVLCEINVSCVSPFPDEVLTPLVNPVAQRLSVNGSRAPSYTDARGLKGWRRDPTTLKS